VPSAHGDDGFQVFGIWKNQWRCLISPMHMSPKNANRMIMATVILHNLAVLWRGADLGDGVRDMAPAALDLEVFRAYYAKYPELKARRCPDCCRKRKVICAHVRLTPVLAVAPTMAALRDELCHQLAERRDKCEEDLPEESYWLSTFEL
jgi:hypothetical protein